MKQSQIVQDIHPGRKMVGLFITKERNFYSNLSGRMSRLHDTPGINIPGDQIRGMIIAIGVPCLIPVEDGAKHLEGVMDSSLRSE